MLPTFVIGLREGLEASLIVGIVAAFLRQRGRIDLLRWVFAGIAAAITLCVAAGVGLELVSRELPQRQQEGLETVIGAFAVAMVSYMVIWMRRHSRDLKGQLEGAAGVALAQGSGWALVAMAFLAVLREGLETAVFLLAAFNETSNRGSAGIGALLGILVSIGLGWAIYRGGVRLNLSKFFRATGAVLVLVAAGLVLTAFHTAHEAGWLNIGQQSTVDLSAFVRPGSLEASVLTGVLGLQPRPVLIELVAWLAYLVPMVLYVVWPPGRAPKPATWAKLAVGAGAAGVVAAITIVSLLPSPPAQRPITRFGDASAQLLSVTGSKAVIRAELPAALTSLAGVAPSRLASAQPLTPVSLQQLTVTRSGAESRDGRPTDVYSLTSTTPLPGGSPDLSYADLATLNGGRLPLGLSAGAGPSSVPVRYSATDAATFWIDSSTGRVVDMTWKNTVNVVARASIGEIPITAGTSSNEAQRRAGAEAAKKALVADLQAPGRRRALIILAGLLAASGVALSLVATRLWTSSRRGSVPEITVETQVPQPVAS
jgi:high-affinity iron transporter